MTPSSSVPARHPCCQVLTAWCMYSLHACLAYANPTTDARSLSMALKYADWVSRSLVKNPATRGSPGAGEEARRQEASRGLLLGTTGQGHTPGLQPTCFVWVGVIEDAGGSVRLRPPLTSSGSRSATLRLRFLLFVLWMERRVKQVRDFVFVRCPQSRRR